MRMPGDARKPGTEDAPWATSKEEGKARCGGSHWVSEDSEFFLKAMGLTTHNVLNYFLFIFF